MLTRLLTQLHRSLPFGIRRLYMPFLGFFRMMATFLLPLYYIEGEEFTSGSHIKLAYLGRDKRILSYWTERTFRQKELIRTKKLVPVWRLNKFFRDHAVKNNISIAIVELSKLTKKFNKDESDFILPRWWETQFQVDKSLEIMRKSDVARRIRKSSLSVVKSNSIKDFHFFYDKMFTPYISARHKDAAIIPDYKFFLNAFKTKDSCINFITLNGERVAGSLFAYRMNKPRLTALGILDGREDIKKLGVIGALYYFQAADCKQQKIETLYLGGTSPILSDGLTKFKLSLGCEAAEPKYLGDQYLWFIPFSNSAAVRSLLKTNPFISLHKNRIIRNIFTETDNDQEEISFINSLKHTYCNNIHQTKIYCFNGNDLIFKWIKKLNYDDVEVLDYSKALNKRFIG